MVAGRNEMRALQQKDVNYAVRDFVAPKEK
jgi:hypothetical protein